MDDDELWHNERRLWLEGADAYDTLLSPDAIMTFGGAVGILHGNTIVESLRGVPRWQEVDMDQTILTHPDPDTAVLAYRAVAARADQAPYTAWCSSVYRKADGRWRIVSHQQTPA